MSKPVIYIWLGNVDWCALLLKVLFALHIRVCSVSPFHTSSWHTFGLKVWHTCPQKHIILHYFLYDDDKMIRSAPYFPLAQPLEKDISSYVCCANWCSAKRMWFRNKRPPNKNSGIARAQVPQWHPPWVPLFGLLKYIGRIYLRQPSDSLGWYKKHHWRHRGGPHA